ncbi:MAG: hypothetical protein IJE01_04420 [Clostridia bacterium]|nr:hypothetical protein [Clostridia bacterium]
MSLSAILITIAEFTVGGFIIWGFWNEEKVIKFEDRLLRRLGFNVKKGRSAKITRFDPGYGKNKHCV